MNVVGLKSPAQNHEQTRQVSAVDVASSLFRVPHSEQVNTPSSDLGCASESMLSLEMKIQIKEFKMARGRKLIICQGSRSPPSGLWHWQRENCCPVTGFPMSAHLGYYASFSGICESGPGFGIGSQLPPCTLLPHSPSSRHPPFTQSPAFTSVGGQPSPHKPRLVVSQHMSSTILLPPRAQAFLY